MPFLGELKQATAYTINIDNSAITTLGTSVTIAKINRREHLAAAETHIVAPGTRVPLTDTCGPRISRVIIQFHPPRGGRVPIEVVQGNNSFVEVCDGDTELVFELVP